MTINPDLEHQKSEEQRILNIARDVGLLFNEDVDAPRAHQRQIEKLLDFAKMVKSDHPVSHKHDET